MHAAHMQFNRAAAACNETRKMHIEIHPNDAISWPSGEHYTLERPALRTQANWMKLTENIDMYGCYSQT